MKIRRRTLVPLIALTGLTAIGCAATETIHVTRAGTPTYDRLRVVYEVPAEARLNSLENLPAVQPADASKLTQSDAACKLRLEVEYPFPGIHDSFAHATLRVVPNPVVPSPTRNTFAAWFGFDSPRAKERVVLASGSEARGDEMLTLDLPKRELDALLYDLAKDGYFAAPEGNKGEVRLALTYNKCPVEKDWYREPRLDGLIEMIKKHGSPGAGRRE